MKTQHLVALAVALVVLFAARQLMTRKDAEVVSTLAGAGLERLVPAGVDAAQVKAVEVASPAAAAAPGVGEAEPAPAPMPLRVERGADGWTVASAHGAPAESAQVDEFLATMLALSGELRGHAESVHEAFGVDAAQAITVRLLGDGDALLATVFLGKPGDTSDAHFARRDGSNEVRHVVKGVRRLLGLWSDDAKPAADHWVQKEILRLDEAALRTLIIEKPDARLVLEKSAAVAAAAPADGAQPAVTPTPSWSVVEPAWPWPVRADSLGGVASRAGTLRVSAVLAAEACAGAPEVASVTFVKEDGTSQRVVVGPAVPGTEDVLAHLEGAPFCYALGKWSVPTLLVKAPAAWDIPPAFADPPTADAVTRLTITQAGKTARYSRKAGGDWTRDGGGSVDSVRLGRVVSGLLALRYDDVADSAKVTGEVAAVHATVVAEAGGRRLSVTLLGQRLGTSAGDRYARVEGGASLPQGTLGVVAATAVDSLLPPE